MVTTSIFNGTANDEIGGHNGGTDPAEGRVLWSQVKEGIDGTVRTFFDARSTPVGNTQLDDSVGNTWNLQGTAAIVAHKEIIVSVREPITRRSNIVDYDNQGADKPITGLAIIGQGEGDDQSLFFEQQTLGDIPLWESKLSLKDTGNDQDLLDQGRLVLSQHADVNEQYTIRLDPELGPKKEDIIVGSMVRIVINDMFTQEDGLFMIGRKRVTLTKQQDEEITLEVIQ